MIDLENKKERDKLIDDYFNKGKECDIKEVYQAIVNSTGDLEYEVDKLKSILKQVREYIEEKYDYILGDDTFLDHDERIDRKQIKHILGILDKEEN